MNKKVMICLIRHGKTEQNLKKLIQGRQDFLLSDVGRQEATITAEYLKEHDQDWDVIYVSPLKRAKQTTEVITNVLGYKGEVIVDEAFLERDFGEAEGMPVCPEVFVKVLDDSWKGIEKTKDICARVRGGVDRIIESTDYKKILIVSHTHAINAFLLTVDNTRKMNSPLINCSMSFVEYDNGEYKLIQSNLLPDNHI